MTILLRQGARGIRRLAGAAALLSCSILAAGELHLHDPGAPDEFCAACTLAHADLASAGVDAGIPEPGWAPAAATHPTRVATTARPFDSERSRAPPRHF